MASMDRLRPSFFSSRYYHLKKLKECNEYVITKYLGKASQWALLDYGCGGMPYKPLYDSIVGYYLGADIDYNPEKDILIDAEGKIDAPDGSFDIILSTQVLEHVIDPAFYLKEAFRVLKPGGLLILSTHGYWMYHPDPTDFWRWTRDGLEKTISMQGFKIVETLGILNRLASGLQLFQDGLLFKFPIPLRRIWGGLFAALQIVFDNGRLDNRDAAIFMVIAQKME